MLKQANGLKIILKHLTDKNNLNAKGIYTDSQLA